MAGRLGSVMLKYCIILFYSGILPCYCYRSHASLAIMLKLCSNYAHFKLCLLQIMLIHCWETPQNSKRDKHPSHWHPSLPALHPHCCHWWPECHCPDAGRRCCLTCFSEFRQLSLSDVLLPHDDCTCALRHVLWLSDIMLSIIDASLMQDRNQQHG